MEEHIRTMQPTTNVTRDGELISDCDFSTYTTDIITEIMVNIHYGSQCWLTNADI